MIRAAIVLALLLSTAVMMRGIASDWRKNPLASSPEAATKKATATAETAPPSQATGLQPLVPSVLPDLKVGYLFNHERMLAGAEPPPEEDESSATMDGTLGIEVSIDEVTYVGSIIADAFRRAIISYPAPTNAAQPVLSRSSRSSRQLAGANGGAEEHAQLELGDKLGGYEVAEIQPEKLIFTKGEETVEKLLYDPGKKRAAPPPRPAGGPQRPQQPGTGGSGALPSSGIQATTIGGAPSPPDGGPGTANPQAPAAPALPPAFNRPASPGLPSAGTRSMPMPIRRMVISRQPPAQPDTSRLMRQSPGTGEVPLPPGMNPDDSIAIPPIPGEN